MGSLISVLTEFHSTQSYYADYIRNLDKRRSTTGYVFTPSQAPMSWRCTLQPFVALSTTEAEYMTMTETMKENSRVDG